MIGIKRYQRNERKLNDEDTTPKDKWAKLQKETGQKKMESPDIIIEKDNNIHDTKKMAKSLNRQYVTKNQRNSKNYTPY